MTEPSIAVLHRRWQQLLGPVAAAPLVDDAFADLVRHYSDPARHYHTLSHIVCVLDTIGLLWPTAPLPLVLAGWLHDVIYDTHASDNEARSADYARNLAGELSLPPEMGEETARLILLTRTHEARASDDTGCVLLDADLTILAANEADYDAYAAAIRREYAWVCDADFRAGRCRVLEQFLARRSVYCTPMMRQHAEMRARTNLAREIAQLTRKDEGQP